MPIISYLLDHLPNNVRFAFPVGEQGEVVLGLFGHPVLPEVDAVVEGGVVIWPRTVFGWQALLQLQDNTEKNVGMPIVNK